MALIDCDEWVKYFESELGIWAHPESLDWAIGKLKNAAAIDPIHYAGGCYCRECVWWRVSDDKLSVWCAMSGVMTDKQGFCNYGHRREVTDD